MLDRIPQNSCFEVFVLRITADKKEFFMIDMHVHLEYADYTFDWIDKFVERAVAMNIDTLCLVEHTHQFRDFAPMYRDAVNYSKFQHDWYYKKKLRNLSEYTEFITTVRKREYPIKLLFGLEVCYFENMEDLIYDRINSYNFDHIIGSVHWLDGFGFDLNRDQWNGIDVDDAYRRHFEIMEKLIESELFETVAHPDSIKLFGHIPSYDMKPTYNRIAQLMKRHGTSAEQNGGAHLKDNRIELGMAPDFLKSVKENHVNIITCSDAHRPEHVGVNIAELTATL